MYPAMQRGNKFVSFTMKVVLIVLILDDVDNLKVADLQCYKI